MEVLSGFHIWCYLSHSDIQNESYRLGVGVSPKLEMSYDLSDSDIRFSQVHLWLEPIESLER